jgi:hypothetical protein
MPNVVFWKMICMLAEIHLIISFKADNARSNIFCNS